MQHLAARILPNSDGPVATARSNPPPLTIPARADEILLQTCDGAVENFHGAIGRRERSHVPRADCVVVAVGEQSLRVGGDGERGHRVRVAGEDVGLLLHAQVPHADFVVDPAGVEFVARLGQTNGRDGISSLDEIHGQFGARVPNPNVPVVTSRDQEFLPALAHVNAVDDFLVPGVPPYALAGFRVPARDVHVGARAVDHAAVARPVQVQHGALVPAQEAVVRAVAGRVPEVDVAVHAAGGDVGAGGVEARAEDFGRVAWEGLSVSDNSFEETCRGGLLLPLSSMTEACRPAALLPYSFPTNISTCHSLPLGGRRFSHMPPLCMDGSCRR